MDRTYRLSRLIEPAYNEKILIDEEVHMDERGNYLVKGGLEHGGIKHGSKRNDKNNAHDYNENSHDT